MLNRLLRNRYGQSREDRGQGRGAGRGRGQGGGTKPGSGPVGNCVCPKCGHTTPHVAGQRCIDQACPKCGTKMIRE
jgi:ssDNA-binding Zn-finger/Zn-ribbon topoisomerase 1